MMNELIIYLLIALIFSLLGFFIGKLLTKLNTEKEKSNNQKEKSALEFEISRLNETVKNSENKSYTFHRQLLTQLMRIPWSALVPKLQNVLIFVNCPDDILVLVLPDVPTLPPPR